MYRYWASGMTVDSELEIPELPLSTERPEVTIKWGTVPPVQHTASPSLEFVFHLAAGAFQISQGREITVDPSSMATPEAVRILLLGRVMAILLRQRGWVPLHASGVAIDGRAVLFVGPSGTGKSTTAAAFHLSGHTVITDDVGAVRVASSQCIVQPVLPRIRLLDDSRRLLEPLDLQPQFQVDKHTYKLAQSRAEEHLPLKRIYILEIGDDFRSEPLAPALATALLNRHSFIKRLRSQPEVLKSHLNQCAAIAQLVPVHLLIRPRSLTRISEIVQVVEGDMRL
jgi:hypothetical protein